MSDMSKKSWALPEIALIRTASSAASGIGVTDNETVDTPQDSVLPSGPQ